MATPGEHEVLYEIRLRARVPDSLRGEFPTMKVRTTDTRTVLHLKVEEPRQLSQGLDKVRSVGGRILGLRRCRGEYAGAGTGSVYEVWVRGELGSLLLWYLRCTHHLVLEPTQVRVALKAPRLEHFVRACAGSGAVIDSVRRVDPVTRVRAAGVSTGPAPAHDGQHRHDG